MKEKIKEEKKREPTQRELTEIESTKINVTDECNDVHKLVPMLMQTKSNIDKAPDKAKADNGYYVHFEKMFV